MEINEEPRVTAIRELKEETGYSTDKMEYLMSFIHLQVYNEKYIYF